MYVTIFLLYLFLEKKDAFGTGARLSTFVVILLCCYVLCHHFYCVILSFLLLLLLFCCCLLLFIVFLLLLLYFNYVILIDLMTYFVLCYNRCICPSYIVCYYTDAVLIRVMINCMYYIISVVLFMSMLMLVLHIYIYYL